MLCPTILSTDEKAEIVPFLKDIVETCFEKEQLKLICEIVILCFKSLTTQGDRTLVIQFANVVMSLLQCHLCNSVYVRYDLPTTLCNILIKVDGNLDQVDFRQNQKIFFLLSNYNLFCYFCVEVPGVRVHCENCCSHWQKVFSMTRICQ